MKANRGLLKYFLLTIITLGIYPIVFWSSIGEDLNVIIPPPAYKKTTHFCICLFLLSWLTLGIYPLYWYTVVSSKMGAALRQRNINYNIDGGTFWLWEVLGSMIIVGPFIYVHKVCKAMNLLVTDYLNMASYQNGPTYAGGYNPNMAQGGYNPNAGAPQGGYNPNTGAPQGNFDPYTGAPVNNNNNNNFQ